MGLRPFIEKLSLLSERSLMDYRLIQSDANPKFKRWRKLAENARFIKKEKATLAEGAHLLLTMAERGIIPAALLLRNGGISDEVVKSLRTTLEKVLLAMCSITVSMT